MRINPSLVLTLALTLTACGAKDEDDSDSGFGEAAESGGGSETGGEEGGEEGGSEAGGDDSDDPMTAALYGSIVDEGGAIITSADIQLCTPVQCKTADAQSDGSFAFVDIEGATFALKIKGEDTDSAVVMTFIDLPMEEVRTIETPIVVPTYKTSGTLGSTATIAVHGGLNVSVDDSYNLPLGEAEHKLKGVQMPPATAGIPFDGIDGDVVGLWYLGAWNTEVTSTWSFDIDSLEGVAAGDTLKVMTGNYRDNTWVDEGTASVSEDGSVTANAGTGISSLSTLLLIKE